MAKKLILVNPVGTRGGMLLNKETIFPPLSLGYIAAVTPDDWDVKVIDENMEVFQFEECDFIGITAFTCNINRAYEIAQEYKRRNIRVIIGGIHASMLPDEVLRYADSVLIGEAELIWPEVILDFESNTLKQRYHGGLIDYNTFDIMPRNDLFDQRYLMTSVQTSRGCPFNCKFCTVTKMNGFKYRQRKIENVINEISQSSKEWIMFVDDNLMGHTEQHYAHAKKLFSGLVEKGIQKKWFAQTSMNASRNSELLNLAHKAGCFFVSIGFESINKEVLKGLNKSVNIDIGVENYKKAIGEFHRNGIGVIGSFIIGHDGETFEDIEYLCKMIKMIDLDVIQIMILTPFPGTQVFENFVKEDRIILNSYPVDWSKYRFSHAAYKPPGNRTPKDIEFQNNYIKNKIHAFPMYHFRSLKSFFLIKDFKNYLIVRKFNQASRDMWLKRRKETYPDFY